MIATTSSGTVETRLRDLDAKAWAEVPCPECEECLISWKGKLPEIACSVHGTTWHANRNTILRDDLRWLRKVMRGREANEGEVCKHRNFTTLVRGTSVPHVCTSCGATYDPQGKQWIGTGRINAVEGFEGLLVQIEWMPVIQLYADHKDCPADGNVCLYTADGSQDCHGTGWVMHPLLRQIEAAWGRDAVAAVIEMLLDKVKGDLAAQSYSGGYRIGKRISDVSWDWVEGTGPDRLSALLDAMRKAGE